jgi:hypothetical protein
MANISDDICREELVERLPEAKRLVTGCNPGPDRQAAPLDLDQKLSPALPALSFGLLSARGHAQAETVNSCIGSHVQRTTHLGIPLGCAFQQFRPFTKW